VLQHLGIRPLRSLDEDMKLQTNIMSYGGNCKLVSVPAVSNAPAAESAPRAEAKPDGCTCGCQRGTTTKAETSRAATNGALDFAKMTLSQKIAYHKARWDRILG